MEAKSSLHTDSFAQNPADLEGFSLPGWIYRDAEFLEAEKERVQTGMGSRSYTPGPLGRTEVSLRSFARRIRELIPESRLDRAPGAGWYRNDPRKNHG